MPRPLAPSARSLLLLPLLFLLGCGDGGATSQTATTTSDEPLVGTITVLAAASLTSALTAVAASFEDEHPGVRVDLSFDASSRLANAIVEGVPADVFASADEANLATVVDAGATAGAPVVIATGRLQIVVPAGNPGRISGLADLAAGGRRVALCKPEVPCGRYAAEAFAKAGIDAPVAGEEDDVKAVLTKVQLGEADAGIVYATDLQAAADVEGVDLAPDAQVTATYPATVLADAPNPGGASAFLAYLTGDHAQAILAAAGFGAP